MFHIGMEPYASYDEEVDAVREFLGGVSGTQDEKKKYIKEHFDVLERLRILYKNNGFRNTMIDKLTEFESEFTNSQNADLLTRIQALRAMLKDYDTKPSVVNRQGLGAGSYGCIVKPALPNRGNNLKWTNYPSNVTKLFAYEDDYTKALNHSKAAYNVLGKQENHRVNEYTFKNWDFSNLGRSARGSCIKSSGPIYPLRIPDLGKSLYHVVNRHPDVLAAVRRLDPSVILNECVRLIEDVHKIYTAGYIHGDIREPNVMINPQTGHMAIIDFDWFSPIEEFKKEYKHSFGFYSNPPEAILLPYAIIPNDRKVEEKCEEYVDDHKRIDIFTMNADSLYDTLEPLYNIQSKQMIFDIIIPTFDSYGLGFTLAYFLKNVYPPASRPADVARFYTEILLPMAEINYKRRITIDKAVEKARAFRDSLRPNTGRATANTGAKPNTGTARANTGAKPNTGRKSRKQNRRTNLKTRSRR